MSQRLQHLRRRLLEFTLTPAQYARTAYVAVGALTVIVMTGAAVRLTGSGLGCPTWPRCYGRIYPPLQTHAVIEFSNRLITVPVSIVAFVAFWFAFRRRPYRRDLMRLSALLPQPHVCICRSRHDPKILAQIQEARIRNQPRVFGFIQRPAD